MTMFSNSLLEKVSISSLVVSSILMVNLTPAMSQSLNSDKVTFFCGKMFDKASGKNIPATFVWIPERKENVRLIAWKSGYWIKTIRLEKRCQVVTQKFQTRYDKGELKYLTFAQYQGYPILCAVKKVADPCNAESLLFTLKPHSNPRMIQKHLIGILGGEVGAPLYQNSGNPIYMPFEEVLQKSAVANPI